MGNLATPKSVQKLQMALHAKAKAEAGYRFYALYDKISRDDILAHAYAPWYELGDPLLVHTQPNSIPGRPYGMCTVLIPALGARLTRNGIEAEGRPWPRDREGHPSSTCVLSTRLASRRAAANCTIWS